jgi:hypothetical protein
MIEMTGMPEDQLPSDLQIYRDKRDGLALELGITRDTAGR